MTGAKPLVHNIACMDYQKIRGQLVGHGFTIEETASAEACVKTKEFICYRSTATEILQDVMGPNNKYVSG